MDIFTHKCKQKYKRKSSHKPTNENYDTKR